MKTYVFNGTEVVLTGRTAHRKIEARTTRRVAPRVDVVHEVEPADRELGSWKKWVRIEELYEIKDSNNNNEEESDDGTLPR